METTSFSLEHTCRRTGARVRRWPMDTYILLLVEAVSGPNPDKYRGIVLRAKEDNTYSRLGIFVFMEDDEGTLAPGETEEMWLLRSELQSTWFNDCEPQTITIV